MSISGTVKPGHVWCLGSINADHIYRLPRLPAPGETLPATGYRRMLGGKGANQSIAAARAGAKVRHVGAVGGDGAWMVAALAKAGVDVGGVVTQGGVSGHALVMVNEAGENAIVIHPGANRALDLAHVAEALSGVAPGDWLLLQNETNLQVEAARLARQAGADVAYSAAPFEVGAARAVLPLVTLLIVNHIEARQLEAALGPVGVPNMLVTKGAKGADWRDLSKGETVSVPAPCVHVRDTTGAGDCFAGYMVAALAMGQPVRDALGLASAAAALQVTRDGASEAIPGLAEVRAFLSQD
ncbi:ribokinase [Roseovarius autotrophicus]|uniref:ribokinase n=1 Tax=Roseovarius autotrophicus TaxID=2824121 RepID=UPI0019DED824|nr:ribokinase [Roseovarius autotrophicus]MBE0453445.1 ribokinase [Roseovarius sp.]